MKNASLISEDEKQTIRAARKVLEKLVKRYARLRKKSNYINCKDYKMYKELTKLKIDVSIDRGEYEALCLKAGLNSVKLLNYTDEFYGEEIAQDILDCM